MIVLQFLLILQYPFVSHLAILADNPELKLLSLGILMVGIFIHKVARPNIGACLATLCSLAALGLLWWSQGLDYLVFAGPIMLPLMLLFVFGETLREHREPLVTAIGEAARGPLSPDMRRYTRKVTWLWTLFFALMAIEGIVLLAFGTVSAWSWLINIINPLLIAILFIGEFTYRRYRFPNHPHPTFLDYLEIVREARRS